MPFIELNLRALRSVFGNSNILLYDGLSPESERVKELADRFDCSYLNERVNRKHFAGCIQNATCSLAFGKANQSDISVKINQRLIALGADIPDRLEAVFADPNIDLAMPTQIRPETIHDERSKMHSRFSHLPDFIAFRTSATDAQWVADAYSEQVRNSSHPSETLTEMFWAKSVEGKFKDRFAALPWMSEPTEPPIYLRKCQHKEERYQQAAIALGMDGGRFETSEWGNMLGAAYRPQPRI